ncbi:MAG: hypothetical protein CM15mP59_5260 [Flavobacteriaceae bacterium]|nr:MAG: hypothetical protein CM15mP59_5260 [Flavobacteriaceae bacterium]
MSHGLSVYEFDVHDPEVPDVIVLSIRALSTRISFTNKPAFLNHRLHFCLPVGNGRQ